MDAWSLAETGSAPLINPVAGPERVVGGGSVAFMVPELQRAVRAMKLSSGPERESQYEAAKLLADSVTACLRPPAPAQLTSGERRDLRAALRALELEAAARGDSSRCADAENGSASRGASSEAKVEQMEIDSRQRQQRMLQDEGERDVSEDLEADREREIERLAGQVSTVNQIYRDLAGLVGAQQEEVDEIENLLSSAHSRTVKAHEQLERAVRRKVYKAKCCLYFAVFLGFFALILVLAIIGFKRVGPMLA